MGRRRYSEEYKREAVALTRADEVTIQGVAKDLGINSHMLGKWRKALEQHGDEAFPGQGHARDEELMQLRRELARVKKERDFLKEAAGFFASQPKSTAWMQEVEQRRSNCREVSDD